MRGVGKDLRRLGLLAWMRLARVFQRVERDPGEHFSALSHKEHEQPHELLRKLDEALVSSRARG
jgi:hypothetical protein